MPDIFSASRDGDSSHVLSLIKLDPTVVHKYDSNHRTPLHYASLNGRVDCIQILLEHQADPNAIDVMNRWTPLHNASRYGEADCVKVLLEHRADLHATDIQYLKKKMCSSWIPSRSCLNIKLMLALSNGTVGHPLRWPLWAATKQSSSCYNQLLARGIDIAW
eukprot:NODE_9958_length_616_cov_93.478702_g9688_i0.p1 GENE.NODE_9958_length_616_cov_93.478702_g9688_i0~~NODE_9958_length_616_cov_93.478702_g9688_i0.p1  ORF type:complete len:172 (-),score=3.62 NODE_9958_length_616_cov_93.478702_g9688_i0:100-585(-)